MLAHVREKLRASVAAGVAAAVRQTAAAASLETQRKVLRVLKERRNRRRGAAALLRASWRNVEDTACLADLEVIELLYDLSQTPFPCLNCSFALSEGVEWVLAARASLSALLF